MAAVPRTDHDDAEEPDPRVWRISVQYITDEDGNRTHVIIPDDQFEALLDELEDLWDFRRLEAAEKERGQGRPLTEILAEWSKNES